MKSRDGSPMMVLDGDGATDSRPAVRSVKSYSSAAAVELKNVVGACESQRYLIELYQFIRLLIEWTPPCDLFVVEHERLSFAGCSTPFDHSGRGEEMG